MLAALALPASAVARHARGFDTYRLTKAELGAEKKAQHECHCHKRLYNVRAARVFVATWGRGRRVRVYVRARVRTLEPTGFTVGADGCTPWRSKRGCDASDGATGFKATFRLAAGTSTVVARGSVGYARWVHGGLWPAAPWAVTVFLDGADLRLTYAAPFAIFTDSTTPRGRRGRGGANMPLSALARRSLG